MASSSTNLMLIFTATVLISQWTLSHSQDSLPVYGAGGQDAQFNGVERQFGESHYSNPEFDKNPTPDDPISYAKGEADSDGADIVFPMDGAGSGTTTHLEEPEGQLNSKRPVSSSLVSQRRGSQLTTIGAGSGEADTVVVESRQTQHKGRLFKMILLEQQSKTKRTRHQWHHNSMEAGDVGSGIAMAGGELEADEKIDSSPYVSRTEVSYPVGDPVAVLSKPTVGLQEVIPDNVPSGPTTNSVYPKWMSGSDALIATPHVKNRWEKLRGRKGSAVTPVLATNVGSGVGEHDVDELGFPTK